MHFMLCSMIPGDFEQFKWQRGLTPLSSPQSLLICIVLYHLTITVLKLLIRSPVTVASWIVATHNLLLCLGSLLMFIGTAYESVQV